MKNNILSFSVLAALSLCACNSDNDTGINEVNGIPTIETFELTAQEEAVNQSINKFALDYFNKANTMIGTSDGNICVSPLSASICLALLANSCDDATTTAISQMLYQSDVETINSTCNKLIRYLSNKNKCGTLLLGNSVWYNSEYTVNQSWSKTLNDTFYSETTPIDFSSKESVDLINSWAYSKTNGSIAQIVNDLRPDDVAFFANALYFADEWKEKFEVSNTKTAKFEGKDYTSEIQMMHKAFEDGLYLKNEELEAVKIPFKNGAYLIAILPENAEKNMELAQGITLEQLDELTAEFEYYTLILDFPKFALNMNLLITPILQELGLPIQSSYEKMGISKNRESDIFQKTYTQFDESGVKVSAVTNTGYVTASEPAYITFNRPFTFFIRNKDTGTILMAGCINNL